MRVTSNFILLLFITITLFSCKENNRSTELLNQAQAILETNPDQSLIFLDSIDNPKNLEKEAYMRYIVTYIGAKKEMGADIKVDTLIFEAQKYFSKKGDFKNLAMASYYGGWVYYANKKLPKSLETFMHGAYAADKSNNYLLAGRSFNNIGFIYYEQDILDSAIINFEKALSYYDKVENVDQRKLKTFTNIGRSFEEINRLDSASFYYNKALNKSIEINNEQYQSFSLQNLGIVSYDMEEYDKAIDYFQSALALKATSEEEILKINLFLLRIYNKKHDSKLAKPYVDLLTADLPQETYIYTVKGVYAALADYYQQIGDYKQALHYRDLEKEVTQQIKDETDVAALLGADKNFHLTLKRQQIDQFKSQVCFWLMVGGVVFISILILSAFLFKLHKKDKKEIELQAQKYDNIKSQLISMGIESKAKEAEIASMLADEEDDEDE